MLIPFESLKLVRVNVFIVARGENNLFIAVFGAKKCVTNLNFEARLPFVCLSQIDFILER